MWLLSGFIRNRGLRAIEYAEGIASLIQYTQGMCCFSGIYKKTDNLQSVAGESKLNYINFRLYTI